MAEIQGLIDMEVVEEVNLDGVERNGGKVISCGHVTTERDHIGSGL